MSVYQKKYECIWQKIANDDRVVPIFDAEKLVNAISNLPEDNSTVINLHFIERISRKDIASRLGWSLSKVNTKLTRGITLLRWECNPSAFEDAKQIFARQLEKILTEKIV
jgi:DNA-directed RNA polymerase specialized sigma24 family protein